MNNKFNPDWADTEEKRKALWMDIFKEQQEVIEQHRTELERALFSLNEAVHYAGGYDNTTYCHSSSGSFNVTKALQAIDSITEVLK